MRIFRVAPLLTLIAVAWAVSALPWSEAARAVWVVPALLWAPGAAWAGGVREPLARFFRGVAVSLGLTVPLLVLGRHVGADAVFAGALAVCAAGGLRRAEPRGAWGFGAAAGAVAVALAVAGMAAQAWSTVALPLDGYWWSAEAEALPEDGGAPVAPGQGWRVAREVGPAWVLEPADATATLTMGEGMLVLRGPVGATLRVDGAEAVVQSDPTVDADEGPVPRYLARGVAALRVAHGGALTLSDPDHSVVYAVPDAASLWELHGTSTLRFGHYYQLLNMVEQLRWARELAVSRWVTDVQPPLWSWPLGLVLCANHGEQPSANVLLLYVALAVGWMGVRVVRAAGGVGLAWGLPALAAAQHVRLMLEPGSAALPDSLYALAVVGVVVGDGAGWGLVAQLARYPGTLVAGLLLAAGRRWRELGRLLATVAVSAAAFGVAGWLTGALDGWLDTVAWETGPEHWHGQTAPGALLPRAPGFYALWLGYAGGAPLLALTAWRARSGSPRTAPAALMGAAFLYSLLLCTIDHTPSHYFLPLLHLSVLAVACAPPGRLGWRHALLILGLVYALRCVPITG